MRDEFYAEIPKGIKVIKLLDKAGRRFSLVETTRKVSATVTRTTRRFYGEDATMIRAHLRLPTINDPQKNEVFLSDLVTWGKDEVFAWSGDVLEAEKPKPKERKATGPTLRTRMQIGTKWRLTREAQVQKPQYVVQTNAQGYQWNDWSWVDDYQLPVGTEVEIVSKITNHRQGEWDCGLVLDLKVNGALVRGVKFQELKDPEQIGEAEVVPVFCIRDTATGLFYEGTEYIHWSQANHGQDQPIIYSDKWSKYRKWKRLSDVRSALLGFSGYYDGLPDAGSLPDWANGSRAFTVPQTWEIVKFDKITKSEVEVIEAMVTFNLAWRLRDLTIKYGSAVRAIYKKIETKKKVDDYLAMLVFYLPEDRKATRYSDDGLTPEELDDIHEAISTLDKNDIRGAASSSYAVAVQQLDTAMMIKLQYSGSLECRLIDLREMTEVIS